MKPETIWIIERTDEDQTRRYWNGRSFGWDLQMAVRIPDKEGADFLCKEVANKTPGIGNHGEVCGHIQSAEQI